MFRINQLSFSLQTQMCKLFQGLSIVFKHIKNTLAGNMGLSMVFKHIKNALAGNVVKLF
jgi:hypothetical protein